MNMNDFCNKFLQDILKDDLKTAMKEGDTVRRDAIRVILGEMARDPKKHLDNLKILSLIKKLIKDEKEGHNDQDFINVCMSYVPPELGKEIIEAWIKENIDFSKYNNKMQAMKPVMAHFAGQVDGNVVKAIIGRIEC